jgi:hypothetical protein
VAVRRRAVTTRRRAVTSVGIVVNPHAAGDVRRLTSLAPNLQLGQRTSITARVLSGLVAAGVHHLVSMSEPYDIVGRALQVLSRVQHDRDLRVEATTCGPAVDAPGTRRAATELRERQVACVVTIGGDGTVRAVAAGWPGAVLVPVAGGTNNTVSVTAGPEAAGLAAGLYARDPARWRVHVDDRTVLEVSDDRGPGHLAVADVALTSHRWTGSHAFWDPAVLLEAVLARADASRTGLAGVGGWLAQLGPGEALHLRFGAGGRTILAPLGPGRFVPLEVRDWQVVGQGHPVAVTAPPGASTLAFDGERELVLRGGDRVQVSPRADGLRLLAVDRLLADLPARGAWSPRAEPEASRPRGTVGH